MVKTVRIAVDMPALCLVCANAVFEIEAPFGFYFLRHLFPGRTSRSIV